MRVADDLGCWFKLIVATNCVLAKSSGTVMSNIKVTPQFETQWKQDEQLETGTRMLLGCCDDTMGLFARFGQRCRTNSLPGLGHKEPHKHWVHQKTWKAD